MSDYKKGFEFEPQEAADPAPTAVAGAEPYAASPGFTVEPGLKAREVPASAANPDDLSSIIPSDGDDPEPERARFWSSPLLWLLLLVVGCGGLQVFALLNEAFTRSLTAGTLWSVGLGGAFGLVCLTIWRELRSVWKLKRTDLIRAEYDRILREGTATEARSLCLEIIGAIPALRNDARERFIKQVQPHFSAAEVFELCEHQILSELDAKARTVIVKRSRENGVVVALSPIAWLDMAFTLARSLRMIREIAGIYGHHCGIWGRFSLYRRIVRNLIFIGMTDLATDALTDAVGAETFGKISAAVGQGLAAGIYSTRLGYMTMKAVRPLPLSRKVVTLGKLRRQMVSGALEFFSRHKNDGR